MKTYQRFPLQIRSRACLLLAALTLAQPAAQAANPTKLDTTTMNATTDWSDAAAPSSSKIGEFTSTISSANEAALTLGGNVSVLGLLYDNDLNGPVIIASGSTLSLYGSGIDMTAANQDVTIKCLTALAADQTWNVQTGRNLTNTAVVSGAFNLTKDGAGTLTLSGVNTFGAAKTFELKNGTLNINNSKALGSATTTFKIDGGTTIDNTTAAAISMLNANPETWNGDFTFTGTRDLSVGAGAVTLNASRIVTVSASTLTVGGVISDGGNGYSLTKAGAGMLVLTNKSTYSGATSISAGELVGVTGGSCSNSAVTVASGATNGVQMLAANGKWTCGALTYSAGTTYADFNFGGLAPSVTTAPLQVTNALTFTGTPTVLLRNVVGVTNGVYPLISYGSISGTPPTTFTSANASGSISNGLDKVLYLVVTSGNGTPLLWAGGNGNWDLLSTPSWKDTNGTTGLVYSEGANVTFDDTASGTSPILVNNTVTVSPASVTANLTNVNYTISGSPIAGTNTLTKNGPGTLTLSGSNTFTGNLTLNAGTLKASGGGAGSLGGASGRVVLNGGTLWLAESTGTNYARAGLTVGGDATIQLDLSSPGADPTYYVGSLTIGASKLSLVKGANVTNTATLSNGGGGPVINGNAIVDIPTGVTYRIAFLNIGGNTITKLGDGTWWLQNPSGTAAGTFNINAGTVTIYKSAGLFSSLAKINLSGASGTARLDLNWANVTALNTLSTAYGASGVVAGSFLRYSQPQTAGNNSPGTIFGTVELNNGGVNPNYTLDFGAGSTLANLVASFYTSPITLSGDASIDSSTAVANYSGGITASTAGTKTLTLTGTNTGANTIFSVIGDGSGAIAVQKTGAGVWILSGPNTYSGPTTIRAGELKFSNLGSATTAITLAGAGATNGVLVDNPGGQWVNTGDLTPNAGSVLHIDYGSTTPSTGVAPMRVSHLNPGAGVTLRIDGSAAQFASNQSYPLITWTDGGPANANAFTTVITPKHVAGNLAVSGNTLYLNVTSVVLVTEPLSWNTGAGVWDEAATNWVDGALVLQSYQDGVDAVVFGDASGATGNPFITLNAVLSPVSVTMVSANHDYILGGPGRIGGSASLTLDAANIRTLILATTNSYTGGTTINAGILEADSNSALGVGQVTMNGGTLSNNVSATLANGVVLNAAGTIGVGSGQTLTLGGLLSGGGALTKTGAGTLMLTNANSNSGDTTISNGVLVISTAQQYGSPNYAVQDGAGFGVLNLGLSQYAYLTSLTLGNSTGATTLAFSKVGSNNLVSTGWPLFSATSAVTLNGNCTIQIADKVNLAAGNQYGLFMTGGITTNSGTGFGLSLPAGVTGNLVATNLSGLPAIVLNVTAVNAINTNPPPLIRALNGSQLSLSWPTNAGWILQVQTNTLTRGLGTNWVDVAGSETMTGVTNTINPANGSVFYRLRLPQ